MHYLYGSKAGVARRLVATFGSEQQLLAYVGWATLKNLGGHRGKFEQGMRTGQLRFLGVIDATVDRGGRSGGSA